LSDSRKREKGSLRFFVSIFCGFTSFNENLCSKSGFWFYLYKDNLVKLKIGNYEQTILDMCHGIVGFYVPFGGDSSELRPSLEGGRGNPEEGFAADLNFTGEPDL
jgi:hypothetical protein